MNKLSLLFAVITLTLLLVGCTSDWKQEYIKQYNLYANESLNLCKNYGQEYLNHYFDGSKWMVQCYQKSPFKIIEKMLGEINANSQN